MALSGCGLVPGTAGGPPESAYTQAEAYAPMEAAAAEAAAALPDFPGFERRLWSESPCSHNGVDDESYTAIEIEYRFDLEDSESALVREDYVDALRDHWTGLGYRIGRDEATELEDRTDYSLVAEREDGIDLWYWVAGYVVLRVQSGCVPVSDPSEVEYVPPIGDIEPGGEHDLVSTYFPDGIPTEQ
ncbi:hypothetical protein [Glycomyces sp. NRRL B-16210]|uniref:hypothetical protein n=1 Tax=Glycomyces sp. NRRL B-16210 TaxID=1463821 RepID=UPI001060A4E3|nr:hypothetical protein [Glycomyces sp. NRRL B-16210]